jgi:hypothetical protein
MNELLKHLETLDSFCAQAILLALICSAPARADPAGCPPEERRQALRTLQAYVLQAAPRELASLAEAVKPGGQLAGWQLTHGHVVMAVSGAVSVGNRWAQDPMPPLLQYAPSPSSSPADWVDFDGPDGPYRLIGWGYLARYQPGSAPPSLRCIAASEWFVHEAGWHLKDGGMHLTPDASVEPPRPQLEAGILMWHPRLWDIHYWIGEDGVPTVSYANPNAPGAGMRLPDGANFRLVNGRKQLLPPGK